jgi:dTDP-4-dehydrorhamnose reductase
MSESDRPILLTGINGQVGGQLLPLLQSLGKVVAPTRSELDLTDSHAIREFVRKVQPGWIVNPAAYTAVDKAEKEPELAFAINAVAPGVLGQEAAILRAPVLHFSTDYVFAGDGTLPWVETDQTGPLGVYGASKLAGEEALAASGASHMVFRTSWVYGATGNNFLKTILRFAREKEEMKIVADQHGAPTWSRDLARLVAYTISRSERAAVEQGIPLAEAVSPLNGIYHACNAGFTTWFGFAQEFVRLAQAAEPLQRFARLLPIAASEYPTPARRPSNSRMSCEKLSKLGFTMPSWQISTAAVVAELLSQG